MKFWDLRIKKAFTLGLCMMVLLGVTGCDSDNTVKDEQQKDNLVLKQDLNIEINSDTNLLSLIAESNKVEIVSEDVTIDTSKLGEQEFTIKYIVNDKEEERTFKVNIVDTTAPSIEAKDEISTTTGSKVNLLKDVKVSDNSKEEITATVEGEYDLNKEGTYNLKYVAVDSSNNKTEQEFTLKVTKPTCNQKSGSWSTTKPSSLCEYTTKTLEWGYMLDYSTGELGWYLYINGIYYKDADVPKDYKKYLSLKPTDVPSVDDSGVRYVLVYIIK